MDSKRTNKYYRIGFFHICSPSLIGLHPSTLLLSQRLPGYFSNKPGFSHLQMLIHKDRVFVLLTYWHILSIYKYLAYNEPSVYTVLTELKKQKTQNKCPGQNVTITREGRRKRKRKEERRESKEKKFHKLARKELCTFYLWKINCCVIFEILLPFLRVIWVERSLERLLVNQKT